MLFNLQQMVFNIVSFDLEHSFQIIYNQYCFQFWRHDNHRNLYRFDGMSNHIIITISIIAFELALEAVTHHHYLYTIKYITDLI